MRGNLYDVLQAVAEQGSQSDTLADVAQELLRLGMVHTHDEFVYLGDELTEVGALRKKVFLLRRLGGGSGSHG